LLDHPSFYDRRKILEGLGENFAIDRVYFKPYACCRWAHSALDAFLALQKEKKIAPEEIKKIKVFTIARALKLSNEVRPTSLEGAQYSIPYCIAAAAIEGRRALLPLKTGLLGRPDLEAVAQKVELATDPDLEALFPAKTPARIIVQTGDREYDRLVEEPFGDPGNPFAAHQLAAKFQQLTAPFLSSDEQQQTIEAIQSLERINVRNLIPFFEKNLRNQLKDGRSL
jgi:2-methylcitrate dehydratase PrpD